MDEKAVKRRGWIKNIAIIFLAVMLVLTLFSNTIMNYSLPEVSAQYCYGGSITTSIRGTGTVEAKETYDLLAPSSSTIKDIGVTQGAAVEVGTVLFLLEDEQNGDLTTAMSELADLKESYNTTASSENSAYSAKLLEVEAAKTELNDAYTKRAAAAEAKEKADALEAEIKTATRALEKKRAEVTKLQNSIDKINSAEGIDDLTATLDAAKAAYDTAAAAYEQAKNAQKTAETDKKNAEANKTAAEKAYREALEANGDSESTGDASSINASIKQAERAIEDAQVAYNRALESYQNAYSKYISDAETKYKAATDAYIIAANDYQTLKKQYDTLKSDSSYDPDALAELEKQLEAAAQTAADANTALQTAQTAYNNAASGASESLTTERDSLEDQQRALTRQKEDLAALQTQLANVSKYDEYKALIEQYTNQLTYAEAALTEANTALTEAKTDNDNAKSLYELTQSADSLPALQASHDKLEAECDAEDDRIADQNTALTELKSIVSDTVTDYQLRTLQNNLSTLQTALAKISASDSSSADVLNMKLEVIQRKIDDKQAEIDKIKSGDYTTQITSPVAGVVTSISPSIGSKVTLNDTIAQIQIVDKGYTVSFTVTNEQASRINKGESAKIQNYWWGNEPTAVVSSIMTDTSNPQTSKKVILDITGDVNVGSSLTFTIGEKSQSYDTVVPNSAIREDNNGKFVLIIEVKSTPLGNRYTARRSDIQVIASDDSNTAISGLQSGSFVITNSSKPLTAGTQVRMIES